MTDTTDTPVIITAHRGTPAAELPALIPRPQRAARQHRPAPGPDLNLAAKLTVGDIPFTVTSFTAAVQWLLTPTTRDRAQSVRLANAYCVAQARNTRSYADLFTSAGINLPDGTPVHWLMQRMARGSDLRPERVRGPSLFTEALATRTDFPVRHFFLGGTPEMLDQLRTQVGLRYPQADIAGMHAPPFAPVTPELIDDWAARICASGATIVWLGLGSPKQDFASTMLAERVGVHCVGVGAAFDFLAGTQREAPRWTQRLALEWAYRLATEPRRLWRRYLIGNIQFLWAALRTPDPRRSTEPEGRP